MQYISARKCRHHHISKRKNASNASNPSYVYIPVITLLFLFSLFLRFHFHLENKQQCCWVMAPWDLSKLSQKCHFLLLKYCLKTHLCFSLLVKAVLDVPILRIFFFSSCSENISGEYLTGQIYNTEKKKKNNIKICSGICWVKKQTQKLTSQSGTLADVQVLGNSLFGRMDVKLVTAFPV